MSTPFVRDTSTHQRRFALLRAASLTAVLVVASIGALVLVGWALNVEVLKSLMHSGRVAMNPATALSLILCAAALLLLRNDRPPAPGASRRSLLPW